MSPKHTYLAQKSNTSATNINANSMFDGHKILDFIYDQTTQTCDKKKNLLQEIKPGIFLFSVHRKTSSSPMRLKKLCDRVQYVLLPQDHQNASFMKFPLQNLCSWGLNHSDSPWHTPDFLPTIQQNAHLWFFFQPNYSLNILYQYLEQAGINTREKLPNFKIKLSNNNYSYQICSSLIPSHMLWFDNTSKQSCQKIVLDIQQRFELFPKLIKALKDQYQKSNILLRDNKLHINFNNISKPVDYAAILDDIIFSNYQDKIHEYLQISPPEILDNIKNFPVVSVRSPIHEKIRPDSLYKKESGFFVVAAKETNGIQRLITKPDNPKACFDLWLTKCYRHAASQIYSARVIKINNNATVISLVGDKISSICLFPALIRGLLNKVQAFDIKRVRLIAHNQDILTIAQEHTSWNEINDHSQQATQLFELLSCDGTDALSLFKTINLPAVGVGTFQLRLVPQQFFELLRTATSRKNSMPPGHDCYLRGLAYEIIDEWELAVSEFKKALRLDNHDADILHALGSALAEIGRTTESIPILDRASELSPKDAELAHKLGQSNFSQGNITNAITAFERAVKLNPGSYEFLTNLGRSYMAAKRSQDAIEVLHRAIRCNPQHEYAHMALAQVHFSTGNKERARHHALLAYNENPVNPEIAQLLWQLRDEKKIAD